MLRFTPDHLKTNKLCKHAVKKMPFVIRYVLHRNKIQEMIDKAVMEKVER